MAGEDWNVGDKVKVKAGVYMRNLENGGHRFFSRGQIIELTEEELDREDFDLVFEDPEAEEPRLPDVIYDDEVAELEAERAADAVEAETEAVDLSNPSEEQLTAMLEDMTVEKAKAFASKEEWTADGLRTLADAEEAGKNRKSVVTYIEERITDLEEEEETGLPT